MYNVLNVFKKKKTDLKMVIGASVGGVLAAGALASLAGWGLWKRGQSGKTDDGKDEDLAKERMVGEGGLNGNAPAVTSKA